MDRLNRALLLGLWLLGAAQTWASEPIAVTILYDNGYPPYSYVQNGVARGLYNDILRAAFARMPAYQVTLKPVPWRRGLAAIEQGKAFALSPPYYRPLERPWMDYSAPLQDERLVVLLRPGIAHDIQLDNFPQAYWGLNLGINAGFSVTGTEGLAQMIAGGQISLIEAGDNRSNLLKLHHGRIDAYINDELAMLWTWQQMTQDGELPAAGEPPVIGPTLSVEHGYLGFTTRNPQAFSYKADFVRTFNRALAQLKREGLLEPLRAGYRLQH